MQPPTRRQQVPRSRPSKLGSRRQKDNVLDDCRKTTLGPHKSSEEMKAAMAEVESKLDGLDEKKLIFEISLHLGEKSKEELIGLLGDLDATITEAMNELAELNIRIGLMEKIGLLEKIEKGTANLDGADNRSSGGGSRAGGSSTLSV